MKKTKAFFLLQLFSTATSLLARKNCLLFSASFGRCKPPTKQPLYRFLTTQEVFHIDRADGAEMAICITKDIDNPVTYRISLVSKPQKEPRFYFSNAQKGWSFFTAHFSLTLLFVFASQFVTQERCVSLANRNGKGY